MEVFNFRLFLNLIRALFPRWNFFDKIAYGFQLEISVEPHESWQEISFSRKRNWSDLFINYETNLSLAKISAVEHFSRDFQEILEWDKLTEVKKKLRIEKLTSFKIVKSIAEESLNESFLGKSYQFRIRASHLDKTLILYTSHLLISGEENN